MDLGIRGRKGIVNGGSAGLGLGSARALAKEGVDLIVVARGEKRLNRVCEEMAREANASVTPLVADHSTEEGRAKILEACPEPDILVGTCSPPTVTGDYTKVEPEHWEEGLATTLISPVEMMRAVIPGMIDRGWGRIVNIGTGASKYPTEIRILSGAPRAALVNYSVAVSKKVAKHGVIINNMLPGMYHTATIHDNFTKQAEERGISYDDVVQEFVKNWRIPAGKFGDPDDFGNFCAMLCSEYANYTVGQSWVMDGGIGNTTF